MTKNWYELSIAAIMNEIFKAEGLEIEFDNSKFFADELKRWQEGQSPATKKRILNIAHQARKYAFNKKYGAYNYDTDVRTVFPEWGQKLYSLISRYLTQDNNNIVSVGSNIGVELTEIFPNHETQHIDIVEISKDAVMEGKKMFPHFNFVCASMDETSLSGNHYDVYLNLRAAYCAGNDLDVTMRYAYSCLKQEGIGVVSVSNGYIKQGEKPEVIVGVYNPNTQKCSSEETDRNLNWVYNAMQQARFKSISKHDIGSEIVLLGHKVKIRN